MGVMRGDGNALTSVDMHPDARTLAVGDIDGTVTFLDARSHRRLATRESGGIAQVASVEFSPDGSRLASAGWDQQGGFLDLFDGRTRRHIARLDSGAPVLDLAAGATFSTDSRIIALQTERGDAAPTGLLMWDARTGRVLGPLRELPGRSSHLLGFAGSRIVTTSAADGTTTVRDAATLRAVREYPVAGSVGAVSDARPLIALGSDDGAVRVLDTRTGTVLTAQTRHDAAVLGVHFTADGRRILTAGADGRLIVWDARRAVPVETLQPRDGGRVTDVAVDESGQTAYSAGRDGTVVAYDLTGARRLERPFGATGTLRRLVAAGHGSPIAALDARGEVELFDVRSPRPRTFVRIGGQPPVGMAVAPDGRMLATVTDKGGLSFWNLRTRERVGAVGTVHARAWLLDFSGDGRWLAVGGASAITYLFDARRQKLEQTVERNVLDVSLSRDGATLAATVREDAFAGGLGIYSVPDLTLVKSVGVPAGYFGRFAADGRSFVYGAREGRVWILDARTWKPRQRPLAVRGELLAADLSADGRQLVTTYGDGTARLWDVASGRPIGGPLQGAPATSSGLRSSARAMSWRLRTSAAATCGTHAPRRGCAAPAPSPVVG